MAAPDELLALLRGEHPDDQPFASDEEATSYLDRLLAPHRARGAQTQDTDPRAGP